MFIIFQLLRLLPRLRRAPWRWRLLIALSAALSMGAILSRIENYSIQFYLLTGSSTLLLIGSVYSNSLPPLSSLFRRSGDLVDQLVDAALLVDTAGCIVDVNETCALWSGKSRQALVGQPIAVLSKQLARIVQETRRQGWFDQDIYLEEIDPPRTCHLHLGEEVLRDDLAGVRVMTLSDISRFFAERDLLKRDLLLVETALSFHHNGMMVSDGIGRVIYRTNSLLETFKLPERTFETGLLGWRNQMAQVMKDPPRFHRFLEEMMQQMEGETLDVLEMADGRWLECRSRIVTLGDKKAPYRIWTFHDFTEQQRREQELQRMSTHDSLTSIHNRTFFEIEIRRLRLSHRFPVSMIMVDVDKLKSINDRLGHPAGDETLRQTAEILVHACRSEDVVARIGGDEFGLLLIHADEEAAVHVVDRIQSLQNLYNIRQPALPISLSLGYAVAHNPVELDTVFQRADAAMYTTRNIRRSTQNKTEDR